MDIKTMQIESDVVRVLKNIYDPEIPVNVYDLGLIYDIDIDDKSAVTVTMTLTAPNCPVADYLLRDIEEQVATVNGVSGCQINLTFDPPWNQDMMTEEAKLELGML